MAISFTDEQQKVIDLRNRNILVSAAAGSGKTAVLVERIITRLTKDPAPINVDELLIVTFTEAAAAEMKERIQNAIEKALEEEPHNTHLQQQATLIHQAKITTIHGFCLSVIRDYFHTIDLDPGFRIAEDGELKLLKHDVVEDLIESYYAKEEEDFLRFVECFAAGKDDRKLEDIILQLYAFSRSHLNPKKWLGNCVDQYDIKDLESLEQSPFVKMIMDEVKECLKEWHEVLEFGIAVCNSDEGPAAYRDALLADQLMFSRWSKIENFREMQEAFSEVKWTTLARNKDKIVSEEKIALVKSVRDEVKKSVDKMKKQYFFDSAQELQRDMLATRENMEVLAKMTSDFTDAFSQKKRSRNLIDFEDMERFALEILTEEQNGEFVPSLVAQELQDKYEEIMIDEYQDSNLVQEAILTSVSRVSKGVHNIFMVGDVKQSIYKFRLSRPELFMEKFHTYSQDDSEKQRIDLHKNFRSRREVLDSTNFVFEQIMTEAFGGIAYDDKAALNYGAVYEDKSENETEVLFFAENDLVKQESIELEARMIAKRIKRLVGSHQVYDKAKDIYRPAEYKDIVILTRTLAGWTDTFAEVLGEEGVPTYTSSKEGYFQTREIKLVLDYLRILDNPYQDIPFTAVLRSMFANVTNEELALVKSDTDEKSIYESINAYMQDGQDAHIKSKLQVFIKQFASFREKVSYTSIHTLLWKIIDETGYGDYTAALPGGSQREANLEMLLSKAEAFEKTSYKGLFHFVRYMEQLHKYDVDYGEANLSDETVNAVTLMSIHKSKGLEFPIVFVAGLGKQFNTMDAKSSIVAHPELGVGLDAIDAVQRTKIATLLKKAIQRKIVLENAAEEIRILYVAMTRAKEKLILTGTVKNLRDQLLKWVKLETRSQVQLSYGDLTKANSYLDWILPALFRNKCLADLLEKYEVFTPFINPLFSRKVPIQVSSVLMEDLEMYTVEEQLHQDISKYILEHWDVDTVYDESLRKQIQEQFAYHYPWSEKQKIKQKLSVSELKKRIYDEEMGEEVYKEEVVFPLLPKFMQEKTGMTGALRGTAYHRLLELLDFTKVYDAESLKQEMGHFVEKGLMEADMAECIDLQDIMMFLDSSVGKRIKAACENQKFHPEQPFVLGIPASDVYGEVGTDETLLVQGIIDVYFEEEDGLVVLDYKTDKVSEAKELVEKYHAQLEYYAKALERLTGKRVKEKIIYSITLQKEIEV